MAALEIKMARIKGRSVCCMLTLQGELLPHPTGGGITETGSLVPGGEVPSRQGKCRKGGEERGMKTGRV